MLVYGARFYDPAIARFTTIDPLTEQFPHQSGYVYADNDPIGKIDFMGLSGESTGMGMNEGGTVDRLGIGDTDGGTLEGPTITASRVGSIGLNTDNFQLYDEVGNSYFHNVGDTRTFDMNQNDPYGVLQSSPLSFTKGGLTREEVYTGFGQWKPTSEFGYVEQQKLAGSFIIGGTATNSVIKGGIGLVSKIRTGGKTFSQFKRAYWAGRNKPTLNPIIDPNTGKVWKQYMELHHMYIPQRAKWAPNWLKNNYINLRPVSSLRHSQIDPYLSLIHI